MRFPVYNIYAAVIYLFIGSNATTGQISLSPTVIYINDRADVASLQIANGERTAKEITISFDFGYPASDSSGNLIMVYDDTISESRCGLGDHLRAFPKHFILEPGGHQIVRLHVRYMKEKTDGVYWTRMIVSSGDAIQEVDEDPRSAGVGTRINYLFRQNIAVFYCKGEVSTGLEPGNVRTFIKDGKLIALSHLKPLGNAPFNGSVSVILSDSSGKKISSRQHTLAVYFPILHRTEIKLPCEEVPAGECLLEFIYETKRRGIPSRDLIQAAMVNKKETVVLR